MNAEQVLRVLFVGKKKRQTRAIEQRALRRIYCTPSGYVFSTDPLSSDVHMVDADTLISNHHQSISRGRSILERVSITAGSLVHLAKRDVRYVHLTTELSVSAP